jgi:hypothetical protein
MGVMKRRKVIMKGMRRRMQLRLRRMWRTRMWMKLRRMRMMRRMWLELRRMLYEKS